MQALRARLHREGRAPSDGEPAELRARYDAAADTPLCTTGPARSRRSTYRCRTGRRWRWSWASAGPEPSESTAVAGQAVWAPSKPVPVETARLLEALLKQRKAEPRAALHPAIAKRCGVSATSYAGPTSSSGPAGRWPKSDPDFSPFSANWLRRVAVERHESSASC